jgi:hypothetical protein
MAKEKTKAVKVKSDITFTVTKETAGQHVKVQASAPHKDKDGNPIIVTAFTHIAPNLKPDMKLIEKNLSAEIEAQRK